MSVFLTNDCKFSNCGLVFESLEDLIEHIEDTHIDYDPKFVKQIEQEQPECLPLSYVLPFNLDDAWTERASTSAGDQHNYEQTIKQHSYIMSPPSHGNTITDSMNSTLPQAGFDFLERYGINLDLSSSSAIPISEKPYVCSVEGCKKRYKNAHGLKYHTVHGHRPPQKRYKCHCGKSYMVARDLQLHARSVHNISLKSINRSSRNKSRSVSIAKNASNCQAGNNNIRNSNGRSNSVEQQSSDSVGGCLSSTSANGGDLPLYQHQQEHQQQLSVTANTKRNRKTPQQWLQSAVSSGAASPAVRAPAPASKKFPIGSINVPKASAPIGATVTTSTNHLHHGSQMGPQTNASAPQVPTKQNKNISYVFIEHTYCINIFKKNLQQKVLNQERKAQL